MGTANSRWTTGLVLLGVPLALFHRSLLGGEALFGRDMAPFFYPMKHFMVETVRSGQLPLWNPWILNGEPFFASLQPGLLYPGSLVLYLLPLPYSVGLLHALHYCVAGAGMYLLLRSWRHERPAALTGALAFMAGGYLLSIGNFTNNLQTVAVLPWVFWSWSRFVASGARREWLAFAAVCSIAFLGGEPQMLALGLGLLLLHTLLDADGTATVRSARKLVYFGLAGALAAALVAVQLIPFFEYLGESVRVLAFDYDFAARNSLEPAALGQLLVPPALGGGPHDFTTRFLPTADVPWLLSLYPGVLVVCLAAIGLLLPRSRRWAWFWGSAALIGLLLAMGRHLPFHRALYELLPPFRLVRYPEKFYFLTALALPVLAAGGAGRWLGASSSGADVSDGEHRANRAARATFGACLLLLAGLAAAAASWSGMFASFCGGFLAGARLCTDPGGAQAAYLEPVLLQVVLVGAALCTAWLMARGRVQRGSAFPVLIVLMAIDLTAAGRHINPTVPGDVYRQAPWAARLLEAREPGALTRAEYRYRGTPLAAQMGSTVIVQGAEDLSNLFLWYDALGPNLGQVFGHLTQDGLQGVELLGVAEMIDAGLAASPDEAVRLLQAMSVRYYADATPAADSMPGLTLVARHPELPARIFEVPDPRPRAYVVSRFEVVEEPALALTATMQPGFELGGSVVLDRAPETPPASGASGHVVHAEYGPNRVSVGTETSGPSLLVLTDRHYPGWRATVNGEPTPIYRAAGHLRAVSLPGGRSEVVFRFAPRTVMAGGVVSVVAALVFAGLALANRGRREAP